MKSIPNGDYFFEKIFSFFSFQVSNFHIFNYFCANIFKRLK